MEYKEITCREHGGSFRIEVKRGRPPVKCSAENPCSKAKTARGNRPRTMAEAKSQSAAVRGTSSSRRRAEHAAGIDSKAQRDAEALEAAKARAVSENGAKPAASKRQPRFKPQARVNASVPKAHGAKSLLEPLGWKVTGRAFDSEEGAGATVTAVRGQETLSLTWIDGVLTEQTYQLWDAEKPSNNGVPAEKRKLSFDPDELNDSELIKRLSGMAVTWWNTLAKSTESAVIPGNRVAIEHVYNGVGDETPGDRMVKFVDLNGSGFRAFRVGALLRVGK